MELGTNLLKTASKSVELAKENAPLILTITSIGLGAGATYMAVRVTPKAYDIASKINENDIITPKEKKIELIRNVAPLYGPAAITGLAAAGAGIASYVISKKRLDAAYDKIAGISTAYMFLADGAKRYRDEVIEKFGDETHKEIQNNVAEKRMKDVLANKDAETKESNDQPSSHILPVNQTLLFMDNISGQLWEGTVAQIYDACADIEERLIVEDSIGAGEFFYAVNANDQVTCSDTTGWLNNDKVRPRIDDVPKVHPKLGILYYDVIIDTNPRYAAYLEIKRY